MWFVGVILVIHKQYNVRIIRGLLKSYFLCYWCELTWNCFIILISLFNMDFDLYLLLTEQEGKEEGKRGRDIEKGSWNPQGTNWQVGSDE